MIFRFNWVIFTFQPLIFRGVSYIILFSLANTPPKKTVVFVNSQSSNPSQLGEFSSMMQVNIHLWTCSTTHGKMGMVFFGPKNMGETSTPKNETCGFPMAGRILHINSPLVN